MLFAISKSPLFETEQVMNKVAVTCTLFKKFVEVRRA